MEEFYKEHIIIVTASRQNRKLRWKPNCTILAEHSRQLLIELKWDLDYETREQAQRVGLLISKKWIDETTGRNRGENERGEKGAMRPPLG